MFAADYSRVRDFLLILRISGDHSADFQKGCATGGWQMTDARAGPKQRSCESEVVLAAVAQWQLMDWMLERNADWRSFTQFLPRPSQPLGAVWLAAL
jgi:hypothetical protein